MEHKALHRKCSQKNPLCNVLCDCLHLTNCLFLFFLYLNSNGWFGMKCAVHIHAPTREEPIDFCDPTFLKSHHEVELCLLYWQSAWVVSTGDSQKIWTHLMLTGVVEMKVGHSITNTLTAFTLTSTYCHWPSNHKTTLAVLEISWIFKGLIKCYSKWLSS